MLTYKTAGESHGKCILALVEGFPAGVKIDSETVDRELRRRQGGYGRGARMAIERDRVEILSGTKGDITLGSPITLLVRNRDYKIEKLPEVTRPRPGHTDLAGMLKFLTPDARPILERSSARETAARTAAGALCKILLAEFDIRVLGYVVQIGKIKARAGKLSPGEIIKIRDRSPVYTVDRSAERRIIAEIDQAKAAGDTLGGVFEVIATGVPAGLGSTAQWSRRLDGCLAQALMSIQAIKAVEIGAGFKAASLPGSRVHDEIFYDDKGHEKSGGFYRRTNRAGGIEGGITNGEPIICRGAMKPISTLKKPLRSVDVRTKEAVEAQVERSDVCAVPAASVVGEAVVAFELARAFLDKFGGDSLPEIRRNYQNYLEALKEL